MTSRSVALEGEGYEVHEGEQERKPENAARVAGGDEAACPNDPRLNRANVGLPHDTASPPSPPPHRDNKQKPEPQSNPGEKPQQQSRQAQDTAHGVNEMPPPGLPARPPAHAFSAAAAFDASAGSGAATTRPQGSIYSISGDGAAIVDGLTGGAGRPGGPQALVCCEGEPPPLPEVHSSPMPPSIAQLLRNRSSVGSSIGTNTYATPTTPAGSCGPAAASSRGSAMRSAVSPWGPLLPELASCPRGPRRTGDPPAALGLPTPHAFRQYAPGSGGDASSWGAPFPDFADSDEPPQQRQRERLRSTQRSYRQGLPYRLELAEASAFYGALAAATAAAAGAGADGAPALVEAVQGEGPEGLPEAGEAADFEAPAAAGTGTAADSRGGSMPGPSRADGRVQRLGGGFASPRGGSRGAKRAREATDCEGRQRKPAAVAETDAGQAPASLGGPLAESDTDTETETGAEAEGQAAQKQASGASDPDAEADCLPTPFGRCVPFHGPFAGRAAGLPAAGAEMTHSSMLAAARDARGRPAGAGAQHEAGRVEEEALTAAAAATSAGPRGGALAAHGDGALLSIVRHVDKLVPRALDVGHGGKLDELGDFVLGTRGSAAATAACRTVARLGHPPLLLVPPQVVPLSAASTGTAEKGGDVAEAALLTPHSLQSLPQPQPQPRPKVQRLAQSPPLPPPGPQPPQSSGESQPKPPPAPRSRLHQPPAQQPHSGPTNLTSAPTVGARPTPHQAPPPLHQSVPPPVHVTVAASASKRPKAADVLSPGRGKRRRASTAATTATTATTASTTSAVAAAAATKGAAAPEDTAPPDQPSTATTTTTTAAATPVHDGPGQAQDEAAAAVAAGGEQQPAACVGTGETGAAAALLRQRRMVSLGEYVLHLRGDVMCEVLGLFHPQRYMDGWDCIECPPDSGDFITRSHFEKVGGAVTAKWYRSIRVLPHLEHLGEWLLRHGLPVFKGGCRRRARRSVGPETGGGQAGVAADLPPPTTTPAAATAGATAAAGGRATGGLSSPASAPFVRPTTTTTASALTAALPPPDELSYDGGSATEAAAAAAVKAAAAMAAAAAAAGGDVGARLSGGAASPWHEDEALSLPRARASTLVPYFQAPPPPQPPLRTWRSGAAVRSWPRALPLGPPGPSLDPGLPAGHDLGGLSYAHSYPRVWPQRPAWPAGHQRPGTQRPPAAALGQRMAAGLGLEPRKGGVAGCDTRSTATSEYDDEDARPTISERRVTPGRGLRGGGGGMETGGGADRWRGRTAWSQGSYGVPPPQPLPGHGGYLTGGEARGGGSAAAKPLPYYGPPPGEHARASSGPVAAPPPPYGAWVPPPYGPTPPPAAAGPGRSGAAPGPLRGGGATGAATGFRGGDGCPVTQVILQRGLQPRPQSPMGRAHSAGDQAPLQPAPQQPLHEQRPPTSVGATTDSGGSAGGGVSGASGGGGASGDPAGGYGMYRSPSSAPHQKQPYMMYYYPGPMPGAAWRLPRLPYTAAPRQAYDSIMYGTNSVAWAPPPPGRNRPPTPGHGGPAYRDVGPPPGAALAAVHGVAVGPLRQDARDDSTTTDSHPDCTASEGQEEELAPANRSHSDHGGQQRLLRSPVPGLAAYGAGSERRPHYQDRRQQQRQQQLQQHHLRYQQQQLQHQQRMQHQQHLQHLQYLQNQQQLQQEQQHLLLAQLHPAAQAAAAWRQRVDTGMPASPIYPDRHTYPHPHLHQHEHPGHERPLTGKRRKASSDEDAHGNMR